MEDWKFTLLTVSDHNDDKSIIITSIDDADTIEEDTKQLIELAKMITILHSTNTRICRVVVSRSV